MFPFFRYILFLPLLLFALPLQATKSADVLNFLPVNDCGLFPTVIDSHTLGFRSFALRTTWNYASRTLELNNTSGRRVRGVIDDLVIADIGGAFGILPWWHIGFNQPISIWQTWQDPSVLSASAPTENRYGKLGDPRIDMKFRLFKGYTTPFGIAFIPFLYLPLGDEEHYLGNGMWSPGATIAFDTSFKKRIFVGFNTTYRNYEKFQYRNSANSFIDDTLGFGLGFRIQINETISLLSEIFSEHVISAFAKNSLQNPTEFLAGVYFEPSPQKSHIGFTLTAGTALVAGLGAPRQYRISVGLDYLHHAQPKKIKERKEQKLKEFTIDQKIYFSFNSSYISRIWYPMIAEVAVFLQKHPRLKKMTIEGHSDSLGRETFNQQISEQRAYEIRDALIALGIKPDRLDVVGFGSERPIADNTTEAGRARNRRVEFVIPVQQP